MFSLLCCYFYKYHSSRHRLGSRGTTATLQVFPAMTATNGVSACGFREHACVCMCVIVLSYSSMNQEHRKQFAMLSAAAVCLYHTVS